MLLFSGHMVDAPDRADAALSGRTRSRRPRPRIDAGARRARCRRRRPRAHARAPPAATCCSPRPASARGVRVQLLLPLRRAGVHRGQRPALGRRRALARALLRR
ncbi:MAG: hypothetical protein MZW92_66235 [Comamonadaceae bacterium]|nr:hypothetical protein [Comamonadaceae bacterium]